MSGDEEAVDTSTVEAETAAPAEDTPAETSGPEFPFDPAPRTKAEADPAEDEGAAPSGAEDDGVPVKEKPAKAPVAPATSQAVMTPALIAQAVRAGMEVEEIADWGDDAKGLERAVRQLTRYQTAQPKKDSGVQHADEAEAEEIPDLDPKEYDEPIVKGWTAMKGMIRRQEQALQQLHGAMRQREAESWNDWFDGQVDALGDESAELFGKGRGTQLSNTSTEFSNRGKLWDAVKRNMAGRSAHERDEVFKQAYRAAFGENIEKAARQKIAANLTARRKTFTNPPSQRTSANSLSSTQRAEMAVAEKLRAINSR